jgi:hypothetical protein
MKPAGIILDPLDLGSSIPGPSFGGHNRVGFLLSSIKEITANFQKILEMKNCPTYVSV